MFGPSIDGETGGAFKIGVSSVTVNDAGPLELIIDVSSGYSASWLLGRAGHVETGEAQKQGWVIPADRKAAEKGKNSFESMEEKKKEKEKNSHRPKSKGSV